MGEVRTTLEHPWRHILSSLTKNSNRKYPPPQVRIVDTVLTQIPGGGDPDAFFYTACDGCVKLKAGRSLSLKSIENEFLSRTSADHGETGTSDEYPMVAIARMKCGDYIPMSFSALHAAVTTGALPAGLKCIHPFVCAKDYKATGICVNYQHQYVVDDTGDCVSTGKTYKRVPADGPSEADRSPHIRRCTLTLSKDLSINADIRDTVKSIVLYLERLQLRCRVLHLTTDFILDERNNLWLVGVTTCTIASRPTGTPPGTLSPPRRHQSHGYATGRFATEQRSRIRKAEEIVNVPDDAEYSVLLESIGYKSTSTTRRRAGRPEREGSSERTVGRDPTLGRGGEDDGGKEPICRVLLLRPGRGKPPNGGERPKGDGLGEEEEEHAREGQGTGSLQPKPRVVHDSTVGTLEENHTNRIYGSTQLEGCRGDFCDFEIDYKIRETHGEDDDDDDDDIYLKTSMGSPELNGVVTRGSPSLLKRIVSLEKRLAPDALVESSQKNPAGPRSGGRGPRASRHSDGTVDFHDISYKSVVQARHEAPLVDAFLRGYSRGEVGDYPSPGDTARGRYVVGSRYPGVYYRSVKVCSNCYVVYMLIDEARAQVLRRIRSSGSHLRRAGVRPGLLASGWTRAVRSGAVSDDDPWVVRGPGTDPESCVSGSTMKVSHRDAGEDPVFAPCREALELPDDFEHSLEAVSLSEARRAMGALTQNDIFELRSFNRPPPAVVYVASAATILVEGKEGADLKRATWEQARAKIGQGDFFLSLRNLDPVSVTDARMEALRPALESPGFRPAFVRPFNNAAANLCLWVLGVVQAHLWMTGRGHPQMNVVPLADDALAWGESGANGIGVHRNKAMRHSELSLQYLPKTQRASYGTRRHGASRLKGAGSRGRSEERRFPESTDVRRVTESLSLERTPKLVGMTSVIPRRMGRGGRLIPDGPATSPLLGSGGCFGFGRAQDQVGLDLMSRENRGIADDSSPLGARCRSGKPKAPAQAVASRRLMDKASTTSGAQSPKDFACSDGKTRLPYRVCGQPSFTGARRAVINFVAVHDFFDNIDKTEMLFKPILNRYRGCRVLSFSYPGQAGTIFEVPSSVVGRDWDRHNEFGCRRSVGELTEERERPPENAPNNTFLAPRLHELLQHVHHAGDMDISAPFHLVGIGNGASLATAFALRYRDYPLYRSSLRSLVSVNGFCAVDPQLTAILHSSLNAFATLPPARPDLPSSFVSRYIFSDDYLRRVGRDLALDIYTAACNPIRLEGRRLVCRSALLHEDLSGEIGDLRLPFVVLQSTEDLLVNPANVDHFLKGRSCVHHFWSHEFVETEEGNAGGDGSHARSCSSVFGKKGLASLWKALSSPKGAFVAWVRAGHEVRQEAKRAVVDLLHALAGLGSEHASVGRDAAEAFDPRKANGAIGFYPSGELVHRANHRDGIPRRDNGTPPKASAGRQLGDDGEGGTSHAAEPGPGEMEDRTGDAPGYATKSPDAGSTSASPFPPDLSIPPFPARVRADPFRSSHVRTSVRPVGAIPPRKRKLASCPPRVPGGGRRSQDANDAGTEGDLPVSAKHGGSSSLNDSEIGCERREREREAGAGDVSVPSCAVMGPRASTSSPPSPRRKGFFDRPVDAGLHSASQPVPDGQPKPGIGQNIDSTPPHCLPISDALQRRRREWLRSIDTGGAPDSTEDKGVGHQGGKKMFSSTSPGQTPTEANPVPTSTCGSLDDLLRAEACLETRLGEARQRIAERRMADEALTERRIAEIHEEQEGRRRAYAEEDRAMIADLERQLAAARLDRAPIDLQRAVEGADFDDLLVRRGVVPPLADIDVTAIAEKVDGVQIDGGEGLVVPSRPMPPLEYSSIDDVPEELRGGRDAYRLMNDAARDEKEWNQRRFGLGVEAEGGGGSLGLEEFQRDKEASICKAAIERMAAKKRSFLLRAPSDLDRARAEAAIRLQPHVRGRLARRRVSRLRRQRIELRRQAASALCIQATIRGRLARLRVQRVREAAVMEIVLGRAGLRVQRVWRGTLGRRRASDRRRGLSVMILQRYCRGYLGRRCATQKRRVLETLMRRHQAAVRIQSSWRRKVAVDSYSRDRVSHLAAKEIQRAYRGRLGRRKARRKLEWMQAEPGPERLRLGLRLIEETKVAFERQRLEIARLHAAEEKAMMRTSRIRKELGSSERDLGVLEGELHELDSIEENLRQLTHERRLVQRGLLEQGKGLRQVDTPASPDVLIEDSGDAAGEDEAVAAAREARMSAVEERSLVVDQKEAGFALEMQIQIRRAEREGKRQMLEAEFRSVCEEVSRKRQELDRIGGVISEIEALRTRKELEFGRMQAHLMELLLEQKNELDAVREKGTQLEVASATSAAAATATAQRTKEHEERSSALFAQTEELVKFQFMSMSLSYFSAINMLKTMRDINAVTSSADAAAVAAASAAAASLPAIKAGKTPDSVTDVVGPQIELRKRQIREQEGRQGNDGMEAARAHCFPQEVRHWTTKDVRHFLDSLGLGRYREAFEEAVVDGDLLLALESRDCAEVLGIEHTLHSKKLFMAIGKLRSLGEEQDKERQRKAAIEGESSSDVSRGGRDGPDVGTVLSQVRHGHIQRLEESLNRGFPVDSEDELGNTALLVACQNVQREICEMLLRKGADVNHANARGNTALHFAMAYDAEGLLGEMLISKGGDDTLTNVDGLTCYDGFARQSR